MNMKSVSIIKVIILMINITILITNLIKRLHIKAMSNVSFENSLLKTLRKRY